MDWEENETLKENMVSVHNTCKNTKIVQALQQSRDDEKRVGLVKLGETRWWTFLRMMEHLKKNKSKLAVISLEAKWAEYIEQSVDTLIKSRAFWDDLDRGLAVVDKLYTVLADFEAKKAPLSSVYYRWTLLLDEYGYYDRDSDEIFEDDDLSTKEKKFICQQLMHYWKKRMFSPLHLESYILDKRFAGRAIWIGRGDDAYNMNWYLKWIVEEFGVAKYRVLMVEISKYWGSEGDYHDEYVVYNEKSDSALNEEYWRALKLSHSGNKKMMELIQRGRDNAKRSTGISATESAFSPIKYIQCPTRSSLGPKKLCKLLFIYTNYRFFKAF